VISPEELEREIEGLVADCGADLERRLRYGKLRLPEHLVGEVINDALLVVVDKRRRGHTISNPGPYLFTVARNAAIDRLRTLYATGIPDPAVTSGQLNGHGPANGHDMLAHAEISNDLRAAIKLLPRRQRQVIELRYLREFTIEETARILDLATGTVGPTTAAALRRLKGIMTEHGEAGKAELG
jgi:RNA polymerase sigma factor (sigma-70 family)